MFCWLFDKELVSHPNASLLAQSVHYVGCMKSRFTKFPMLGETERSLGRIGAQERTVCREGFSV